MARFDRFKKLERARPEAPPEGPEAQSPQRFGKIEARKAEPAPRPHDPFAPPPDDDHVPLEVADDDARELQRLKAEREAKAQAQLAAEAQQRAELAMRREAEAEADRPALDRVSAVLSLGVRERAYILGALLVAIGVLAAVFGTFMWGLAPIAIAVFVASVVAQQK